jgi:hypothetical protein
VDLKALGGDDTPTTSFDSEAPAGMAQLNLSGANSKLAPPPVAVFSAQDPFGDNIPPAPSAGPPPPPNSGPPSAPPASFNYMQTPSLVAPLSANTNSGPNPKVVALYDSAAENPDELEFFVGDIIEVLEPDDQGWSKGLLRGVQGLYPTNYVKPVEN